MANRRLFASPSVPAQVRVNPNKWIETQNEAGGAAFSLPDKNALAQLAVTGTFSNTYYATAEDQLDKVKTLAAKVDSPFIAKLAVYAHEHGRMKDMPAYLAAVLHGRGENELLAKIFPRVISNFKMLSNFVQIVRSGVVGRKSFASATKRLVKDWLANKTAAQTFNGSIGLSAPSVADIIKMVHPAAINAEQDAVYAYLVEARNWTEKVDNLPDNVKGFEALKQGKTDEIPDVPFRALTNVKLTVEQWRAIADNMPWNTLRQNLNMLAKRGVLDDNKYLSRVAARISDPDEVVKAKVLPYQLFTTYQNTEELPSQLRNALQDAAEVATRNVPSFDGNVVLAIDVSGSMSSAITGSRGAGQPVSKTKCVDVAGLMASCVLRQNKNARVMLFDTRLHDAKLNPRDSIMTNAAAIARFGGGGTDCSLPIAQMVKERYKADLVIYVSDNESWSGHRYGTAAGWAVYSRMQPNAKLVNIDIQPYPSTQVPDSKNVLNIGGFNDSIWTAIEEFAHRKEGVDFVSVIEKSVEL